jgi:hypothetical protein
LKKVRKLKKEKFRFKARPDSVRAEAKTASASKVETAGFHFPRI